MSLSTVPIFGMPELPLMKFNSRNSKRVIRASVSRAGVISVAHSSKVDKKMNVAILVGVWGQPCPH